jgi:hypothetical protein
MVPLMARVHCMMRSLLLIAAGRQRQITLNGHGCRAITLATMLKAQMAARRIFAVSN